MRTLHDVEEAFQALADTAPEPMPLLAEPAGPVRVADAPRPRRWLAPIAVAAATAAVVSGAVYLASGSSGGADRPATGSGGQQLPALPGPRANATPGLTFRFTAAAPQPGLVTSYGVDRGGQVLYFLSPVAHGNCGAREVTGCDTVAQVTLHYVHAVGDADEPAFTIARAVHRVPVRVAGHDGFYASLNGFPEGGEMLFWQYAPGAWGEVRAGSRAAELALAESARPATVPLAVPVAPARLARDQYVNTMSANSEHSGGYEVASRVAAFHHGYFLSWGKAASTAVALGGGAAEDITVNGRTWTITGSRQLVARLEGSAVPIAVQPYIGTTRDELRDILNGLRIAPDLGDPASWPAAAIVFG